MAKLTDVEPTRKRRWTDEDRRLLNAERIDAWLEEMTAVSRRYGIRLYRMGDSGQTISTLDEEGRGGEDFGYTFLHETGREWGKVVWSKKLKPKEA